MSASKRKTHPLVLIAATALTVFSILGSAMITGLIPSVHSERANDGLAEALNTPDESKTGKNFNIENKKTVSGKISQTNQVVDNIQKLNVIASCANCGKIVSITRLKLDGEATGLGAIAGGVTGGVIGNQIGKGQGNVLMTILGVGGGAYAGQNIEKKINAETAYVIKVKMENGEYKTVRQHQIPSFAIGDTVKFKNGSLSST